MNWDFIYRGESRDIDEAARAGTEGSFIRLPQGFTHFELRGPITAQPVVLVHGFSVPYFIWDLTVDALLAAGRRVLRYDLFGRGYSDRPHVRYSLQLFIQQLDALLDSLGLAQVDLVGLSMGGVIAAGFAVRSPERVRQLVLIDPIGTDPMPLGPLYKAALLPGISELVLSMVGTGQMVESLASDFFDPSEVQQFKDRYQTQMQYRGFKRAIISSLRNKAVSGSPQIYEQLGRLNTPVLLVWGRQDHTLPLEQSASILRLVPRAQFEIIEDSGHIPNCEKPDVFHPILLNFLDSE
ncbi:MAG TPA: alpha/beta fold hydrolase [Anaerolineales bacterium]